MLLHPSCSTAAPGQLGTAVQQQQRCSLAPPGVSVVTCSTEVWKAGEGTMRAPTLMPLALTV